MSKILILTASPQRDRIIDDLLKNLLEDLGNEVFVRVLPFNAVDSIMELKPDVLVIPPIRNLMSYNLAKTAIRWGIGVVIRHVEPGCDEKDLKDINEAWNMALLFGRPEGIQFELMWGQVEADYVKKITEPSHPIVPVGAFVADVYKNKNIIDQMKSDIRKKHGLDETRKTILIGSPWGLFDIESDLPGEASRMLLSDRSAEKAWIEMVKELRANIDWNILVTLHPGLTESKMLLKELDLPVDTTSTSAQLLTGCDVLIHAGSTMALEMHWLDKPSFQFGDVNSIDLPDGNWWQQADCAISKVSPFYLSGKELAQAILKTEPKSNANIKSIKELELGRYGPMDGNATERAAALIDLAYGKFKVRWPLANNIPVNPFTTREFEGLYMKVRCSFCEEVFWLMQQSFLDMFCAKMKIEPIAIPNRLSCPCCSNPIGNKIFRKE